MCRENLHDPKLPCLGTDSINQRAGENPPRRPPSFVLRGDKLIPGRLISRGTRRAPNFPKIYAAASGFIEREVWRTKSIYFILPRPPPRSREN